MSSNKQKPTERELEILQVLWEKGPSTVRFVNDNLQVGTKEVGYTTTLKFMQIMYQKGLLSREQEGKTHIYKAEVSEKATQKQVVKKLLSGVFKGATSNLVIQALGNGKTSREELNEIKAYLKQMEDKQ